MSIDMSAVGQGAFAVGVFLLLLKLMKEQKAQDEANMGEEAAEKKRIDAVIEMAVARRHIIYRGQRCIPEEVEVGESGDVSIKARVDDGEIYVTAPADKFQIEPTKNGVA